MSDDAGPSPEALAELTDGSPDDERYSPEQLIERRQATNRAWVAEASAAIDRHQLELTDDVVGGVPCLRVRSQLAQATADRLMWFFGGGFVWGEPRSELQIVGPIAERTGAEVVLPSYRLAPEDPWPAATIDAWSAWEGLADDGRHGRLWLGGESAGGNLALGVAQRARREGRRPDRLALLSPAVDLRTSRSGFGPSLRTDPTLSYSRFLDIDAAYVAGSDATDPTVSPLLGDMDALPPTIITTGSNDLLLGGCLRLARKLRQADVRVECMVWDRLWHVFEFDSHLPEAVESLREVADFLRET